MRKNTAGQDVAFQMVSTTDGSAVTSGTPTVYVTKDGGTQATGGGTSTHKGNGAWNYAPTQAETNADHCAFTMALSGAVSQTVNTYPVSYDPTAADLGLNNFDPASDAVATVTNLTNLPSIPANWLTAAGIAASALDGKGDWNTVTPTTPPTAAAIADAVWDESVSGHNTGSTFGNALQGAAYTDIPTIDANLDALSITVNNLENVSAGEVADAVWDEAQGEHATAGTFGEIATEVATIITDIAALNDISAADVWASGTRTLTAFGFNVDLNADQSGVTIGGVSGVTFPASVGDATAANQTTIAGYLDTEIAQIISDIAALNDPTAAAIADAVWDELQSEHTTAGTFGLYLDDEVSNAGGGGGGDATSANQTTIINHLTSIKDNNGGADFDASTDSLEAIRNRGDSAWTGGGGGSSVVIGPVAATVNAQTIATTAGGTKKALTHFANSELSIVIQVVDGNGDAFDIAGNDFELYIHDSAGTEVIEIDSTNQAAQFVTAESGATPGTTDQLTVTVLAADVPDAKVGEHEYKLWDKTRDVVYCTGKYSVLLAPKKP